jgi:hypothetical protein
MPVSGIATRTVGVFLLLSALLIADALSAEPAPVRPVSRRQIRLWFGGDVHFGNALRNPLLELRTITDSAIGVINLEGPVREPAETVYQRPHVRLYNAPRTIDHLGALNVRIAALANNHQDDAGPEGRDLTEGTLRSAGIMPVGGSTPSTLYRVGGYRLVFVSYALAGRVPTDLGDELTRLRRTGDMLIVLFHTGGTPSYLPSADLRTAVEIAVRAGASIIVSHGSHAIGPLERREATIIAWGLGNLAFNCDCTEESDAVILAVTVEPAAVRPLASACVIPIDAGMQGAASAPARDPTAMFDLLDALGSSQIFRLEDRACF